MPALFGTDGVRGVANRDLTPDFALALGRAAGLVLASGGGDVIVGRDTRPSGPMLEGALVAGLSSAGARALLAGVIPTPGVAFLTLDEQALAGAVISASHNPVEDNGIKFFSQEGMKIPAEVEEQIEAAIASPPSELPTGTGIGWVEPLSHAVERYLEHLLSCAQAELQGLTVVLDCAFGAAWSVGPRAFERAGAEVIAINDRPDGARINVDCGSTALGGLAERVAAVGADIGLGFDGDADRVLAVDEKGNTIDGDQILGLTALALAEAGGLVNNVVVATVMSNLGLRRALEARGIEVVLAPVGDKFVAEAMAETGAVLGGEQSGHVIFGQHATTGDGVLTGLQLAGAVAGAGVPLSGLAHFFEPFPQVLVNVPVPDTGALDRSEPLWEEINAADASLGEDGRVLVRASGTEPVIRVMVEAASPEAAQQTAQRLADAVADHVRPPP
jgi:phosphoglucosamine mutase